MHIFLYIMIFLAKVTENALGTLRIIVVANGKKILGAILQGVIALVWIGTTGVVIVNVLEDPYKVIAFALGATVGSYLGSFIEEKVALGNNMLIAIVDKNLGNIISSSIRRRGYAVTSLKGEGMYNEKIVLMIIISRKKRNNIADIIKKIDENALVIAESALKLENK